MIDIALTIEELSKLIKDGFEYQGKVGRYQHFQKYETFGCGASIDSVIVPTDDVFAEMEAYLSHLKGISFESLRKTPYSEVFSKKYKHGTVFADVNDLNMQSVNQGVVEIDISTSGIPEEIEPALPILFGIFKSMDYRLYPTGRGTHHLYKNGHSMRLGEHPIESLKEDISLVDLTMTSFPGIAGNINAMLPSHKPQAQNETLAGI